MLECILVGIGGFIGSVLRYLIGLIPIETDNGFPVKTLAINVVGSFFISLIVVLAARNKAINPHFVLMLKVGVCGGFTTFSTFAYESAELMKSGHMLTAFAYVCLSIVLSVAAVFTAQMLLK
ncbi:MAG: fluoride efflux transporter CrcB [Lachnospiraceae bacterium]|nr:fluoride efflux transporter CrcB [Lachnospiraceae bacterium]